LESLLTRIRSVQDTASRLPPLSLLLLLLLLLRAYKTDAAALGPARS